MTKAEKILNKCEHILDDYDAEYRGGYVDVIDGTTYIVFKYYGGKHDTIDRNDDSWDEMYELEGVADVGYGSGYGMGNTKYEDMLLIELEDGLNESKKSARKFLKEAKPTNYRGIHISVTYAMGYDYYVIPQINKGKKWNEKTLFATLKEVKQYIDDHYDELVELCNVKESKESARNSIKESKIMSYDEFKKIVKKEFTKDEIEGFGKTDNGYGVYVIAYGENEIETMCDDLRQYGFECKWWHSSDPEDDEPIYFIEAIPIMNESKNSTRKSIKEANESVIIDGKKTNFKINDYGTFFGEKIKYMLIGKPSENKDVLADFLEENSNFEFEEYKIPYSTVYYIYNDEESLFGVAYRHYIRLTNDEKDAKIMLAYATDKRDLYNGL